MEMEKRKIYMQEDKDGKLFFKWEKSDGGGYYNLDAMLRLKGLTRKDVVIVKA